MKECPICHTQYEDSQNFCINDGSPLKSVSNNDVKPQQVPSHRERKGGCLKRIIIGSLIVCIVLVCLYNHITNAATYLRTEPNTITVVKGGGECKIDIDYDGYIWTVNHQPEWVDIDENERDFDLKVFPNTTGQPREGSITIQSGKQLAQVIIRQNAVATVIRASETSVKFGENGGNREITIETDGCKWEAEYTNWMTVTKEDDDELHIRCPRNDEEYRTGTITVKEDNARVTIQVIQSGKCNNCHGSGSITCGACNGMGGSGYGMFYANCIWCGGRGSSQCGSCGGSGQRD